MMDWADCFDLSDQLTGHMGQTIRGKDQEIRLLVCCLFAGGHMLIEDLPGLGKTTTARVLSRLIDGETKRIQFTPDLLPSDIVGVSIFNQESRTFEFRKGPVFTNILIGDEINRASPRTQSALLEVMSEGSVTVDGDTRRVPSPFMVIATQNPIEMAGTFSLPEAQVDRFLMMMSMGYPDFDSETQLVRDNELGRVDDRIEPITNVGTIGALKRKVAEVHVSDEIVGYVVSLVRATREHDEVKTGCSPRASVGLVASAKAWALIQHRTFVLPEDVQSIARSVLSHRVLAKSGRRSLISGRGVIDHVVADVALPLGQYRP